MVVLVEVLTAQDTLLEYGLPHKVIIAIMICFGRRRVWFQFTVSFFWNHSHEGIMNGMRWVPQIIGRSQVLTT